MCWLKQTGSLGFFHPLYFFLQTNHRNSDEVKQLSKSDFLERLRRFEIVLSLFICCTFLFQAKKKYFSFESPSKRYASTSFQPTDWLSANAVSRFLLSCTTWQNGRKVRFCFYLFKSNKKLWHTSRCKSKINRLKRMANAVISISHRTLSVSGLFCEKCGQKKAFQLLFLLFLLSLDGNEEKPQNNFCMCIWRKTSRTATTTNETERQRGYVANELMPAIGKNCMLDKSV